MAHTNKSNFSVGGATNHYANLFRLAKFNIFIVRGETVFSRIPVNDSSRYFPYFMPKAIRNLLATMAEHTPVTEDRIQSLVCGIVGEFF